MPQRQPIPLPSEYEQDFMLWAERQVDLLRAKKSDLVDLDKLVEEMDDSMRKDKRDLRSRILVVSSHLLKCLVQADHKTNSWLGTLHTQRLKIQDLLIESPSLKGLLTEYSDGRYAAAVRQASIETGLPTTAFPISNPFTVEQLLDDDFIP